MPRMMKVIQFDEYGGPEQLKLREVPVPTPAAGQVLVKVRFASVNAMDRKMREGAFKAMTPSLPATPGGDMAGTVEAVGAGADLEAGAAVFGRASGCYAEYVVAAAGDVARKPSQVTFEEAAALPVAGVTAWQAVVERGRVKPGERVLIQGGSGGVGHLAVQIAKLKGAHVVATASSASAEFVRGLGADEVVDYHGGSLEAQVRNIDLVVDGVGADSQVKSYATLRHGGRLVSLVGPPPPPPDGVEALAMRAEVTRQALMQVADLVEKKQLRIVIAKVFPLAQAGDAQEYAHQGGRRGKVLLAI